MNDQVGMPSLVDMNNWEFVFKSYSPINVAPPRELSFATAHDLVFYLASEDQDNYGAIQMKIDKRLEADSAVTSLIRSRSLLKDLKHFPHYRRKNYGKYQAAARLLAVGTASPEQKMLVEGLASEIEKSKTVAVNGQILFHGRADREITNGKPYPGFISTSLNPIVARNSAFRRAHKGGVPTFYLIKLQCDLPALWGQTGKSCEYEMLLPLGLRCELSLAYKGSNFDVVEANIIGR
jgi:hypothetical protein